MTEYELRRLAKMIVELQSQDEAWLMAFARAQAKLRMDAPRYVSAKEAARMLGISVSRLYHIKDDEYGSPRFSYVKGGSQSSPLKFDANVLMDEYRSYLDSQKKRCVVLKMENGGSEVVRMLG